MSEPATFPEPREWRLVVSEVVDLTPSMRRIRLAGDELGTLVHLPGQDMAIAVPLEDGTTVRRRYTIRHFDAAEGTADLDFVRHGDGPAARWAAAAAVGEALEAIAPRGKITPAAGDPWHLFVGDDTAVPGVAAMIEALPAGSRATALLEVDGAADELPLAADGVSLEVAWLHRDGAPPGGAERLLGALAELDLPEGHGHAYLAGEFSLVHALRRALAERGLEKEQVSPKPYWRIGRRNMAHGEPERD